MKKTTILIVSFILLFSAFFGVSLAQESVSTTSLEIPDITTEDEIGGDDIVSSERQNDGSLPDSGYEEVDLFPVPTLENSIEQVEVDGVESTSTEGYSPVASAAISLGVVLLILLFFVVIRKSFNHEDLSESDN